MEPTYTEDLTGSAIILDAVDPLTPNAAASSSLLERSRCRSPSSADTTVAGVAVGDRRGLDDRSFNPAAPSCSNLRSHR